MTMYCSNVKLSINFGNSDMINELRIQLMSELSDFNNKYTQIHNTSNKDYVDIDFLHEESSYEDACVRILMDFHEVLVPLQQKFSINGYTIIEHQFRCKEHDFQIKVNALKQ